MDINRLLDPIMRRVRLIISRGKVTGVTDGHKTQNLQVSIFANETMDDVERLIEYGLISVPQAGSQTVLAFSAGVRAHPVALVVADGRTRPIGLKTGDSGLYHFEGHQILLTEDGEIIVTCKKLRYEVEDSITANCKTFVLNAFESAEINTHKLTFTATDMLMTADTATFNCQSTAFIAQTWDVAAQASADITAATIGLNGALTVSDVSGAGAGSARIRGSVVIDGTSTATDHLSGGISGASHPHSGVEPGDGNSGGPIA